MTKHHIEDVSEDVRLRVAYIAGGPAAHAKKEPCAHPFGYDHPCAACGHRGGNAKAELYPAFAANITENQRRWERQVRMLDHAAVAAAVMNHSEGEWNLEWRVS